MHQGQGRLFANSCYQQVSDICNWKFFNAFGPIVSTDPNWIFEPPYSTATIFPERAWNIYLQSCPWIQPCCWFLFKLDICCDNCKCHGIVGYPRSLLHRELFCQTWKNNTQDKIEMDYIFSYYHMSGGAKNVCLPCVFFWICWTHWIKRNCSQPFNSSTFYVYCKSNFLSSGG